MSHGGTCIASSNCALRAIVLCGQRTETGLASGLTIVLVPISAFRIGVVPILDVSVRIIGTYSLSELYIFFVSCRDKVTHYVCSNLPDTKLKQLGSERNPVPIVRAEWIVASLQAGRLLPTKDFQLASISDAPHQRKLQGFARHEHQQLQAKQIYPALKRQRVQENLQVTGPGDAPEHGSGVPHNQGQQQQAQVPLQAAGPSAEGTTDRGQGGNLHLHDSRNSDMPRPPAGEVSLRPQGPPATAAHTASAACGSGQQPGPSAAQAPSGACYSAELPMAPSPQGPSAGPAAAAGASWTADAADLQQAQQVAAKLRADCEVLKGPPRSTRDDPNFMSSFFKASRLHFIGALPCHGFHSRFQL